MQCSHRKHSTICSLLAETYATRLWAETCTQFILVTLILWVKIFFFKQQSGICTKIKDITFKKDVPKGRQIYKLQRIYIT
jgi:hypothetical protein